MAGMNRSWIMGIAGGLVCGAVLAGEWADVPRPAPRRGAAGGFALGRREVAVADFVDFLNAAGIPDFPETAQIARRSPGGYVSKAGVRGQAVSEVTAAEAEAYCLWFSRKTGATVRLPTESEWEAAARGGVDGAPYPWGWGGQPRERAQFDAAGPAARGGMFPANGFGLYDVAGNLYEWCAACPDAPKGQRAVRGGSWSERNPEFLRIGHRQWFPADYRGRDVGFRALCEEENGK